MIEPFGRFIEKHPWIIIGLVFLITIGFSLFLPGLQFITNFNSFEPNNAQVQANNRVTTYFQGNTNAIFLLLTKNQTSSVLAPDALRDQYRLQKNLSDIAGITDMINLVSFVNTICQLEFNRTLENCTDTQIQTAVHDLFSNTTTHRQIITTAPARGIDITSCSLKNDSATLSFVFQVGSLKDLPTPLKPPLTRTHLIEWYIEFDNILAPANYAIHYQLAARITPSHFLWQIGNGLLWNLRQLSSQIRNHTLQSYTTEVVLWLKSQEFPFPLPVKLGNSQVNFSVDTNEITITVSKDELGTYGIAPHYGTIEIPSKLSNFSAGVRAYQTPLLHRAGGQIAINTTYLFNHLQRLRQRPIRGVLVGHILQHYGLNWTTIESISNTSTHTVPLPTVLSLADLQTNWRNISRIPSKGVSYEVYPLFPPLFTELQKAALSFVSSDFYTNKQPSQTIIILQLPNNSSQNSNTETNITKQVNDFQSHRHSFNIQITGQDIITNQINQISLNINQIILPMIIIIIMIILYITYHQFSYVLLSVLVFLNASIWVLGTMVLLHIPFNIIAVAILPVIIGLGVEYSVMFFYNYRAEIEKGKNSIQSILLSYKEVGSAIFLAWTAMFIAFISFLSATVPPVRDFGFLLALGITYSFIVTMTLTVTLRYILDRKKPKIKETKIHYFSLKRIMCTIANNLHRFEKIILIVVIIISIFMALGATQLHTGFSTEEFIPKNNPALKIFNNISNSFPHSSQEQEYILIEGDIATISVLKGIVQTEQNLRKNSSSYLVRNADGTLKIESIMTYIRQAISENSSLLTTYHINPNSNIPATNADVKKMYDYLFSTEKYHDKVKGVLYKGTHGYNATIITVYLNSSVSAISNQSQVFQKVKDQLSGALVSYGNATANLTGNFLITQTVISSLTQSQILSTGISFVLAAAVIIIIYRNPLLGLITMIPVSISILWILGTMYYIGYDLNVLTITVTSITIGVGVDYGIYITQRYRLIADKTKDSDVAQREAISLTGSSVFIAALSSMFGFVVLLFAPVPPQQQFGLITAITLSYALLISIFVLPLILARWGHWRKKHKGYIVRQQTQDSRDEIDPHCGDARKQPPHDNSKETPNQK
jgi:predicted RND superfamily exporter protein